MPGIGCCVRQQFFNAQLPMSLALLLSSACNERPLPTSEPSVVSASPKVAVVSGGTAIEVASTEHPLPASVTSLPAENVEPYRAMLQALRDVDSVLPPKSSVHRWATVYNAEAVVPPMCYTKTEAQYNPCYVCHQDEIKGRPNKMNDADLQEAYSFSEVGTKNHWKNLFEDRTSKLAAISDEEIQRWVNQDNYSDLAERLRQAGFQGYVPDLKNLAKARDAFDEFGFAKDGSHWVAFNYKPLPSTFWPTNGSTDDVMIRLPAPYRETRAGAYSLDVYRANLGILEARIKGLKSVSVLPVDEAAVGEDLDGDGQLRVVERITFLSRFVGRAFDHLTIPQLYPLDTEFLHSVRYLGVSEDGQIYVPPRMKELRYMRKRFMFGTQKLASAYLEEGYDKELGRLPGYVDREQYGLDNEMGWVLAGFLEGSSGKLRFNTYEENLFCMGCHTSIGSTSDSTFSFARKVDGQAGWGYINLRGMPDAPNYGEQRGEIATYLERTGGGSEFRNNPEMIERWFTNGHVDREKLKRAKDVYDLVAPSPERALALNKAYRTIVDDQSFVYGRDAILMPPTNVYSSVDNRSPNLPTKYTFKWDARLDWTGSVLGQN
jgi:hypothetical protein